MIKEKNYYEVARAGTFPLMDWYTENFADFPKQISTESLIKDVDIPKWLLDEGYYLLWKSSIIKSNKEINSIVEYYNKEDVVVRLNYKYSDLPNREDEDSTRTLTSSADVAAYFEAEIVNYNKESNISSDLEYDLSIYHITESETVNKFAAFITSIFVFILRPSITTFFPYFSAISRSLKSLST